MRICKSPTAALLSVLLLLALTSAPAVAQNAPDAPKVTSATTTETPASKTRVAFYYLRWAKDYSPLGAKRALERAEASGEAIDKVNAEVKGCGGGARRIAASELDEMASHLKGGMTEANNLLPLMREGWHIILILDKEGQGTSAPTLVSPYVKNVYQVVQNARQEDLDLNPERYVATASPPKSTTTPPSQLTNVVPKSATASNPASGELAQANANKK